MEGRTLTILFTDVEGSTELLGRVGDAVAGDLLRVHEEIVRARVGNCGGREVDFRGDSFLLTFPTPRAGLLCALAIRRDLETHGRSHPDRLVRVRLGLHVGPMLERDGMVYGQAVHAAARIMTEAAGGEVLVSEAVREATRDEPGIEFLDRGLFWLKGFPERWRLYQASGRREQGLDSALVGVDPGATPTTAESLSPLSALGGSGARDGAVGGTAGGEFGRPLGDTDLHGGESGTPARTEPDARDGGGGTAGGSTPFVGRETEWADLRRSVRAALGGEGGLHLVSGEAGVGKTRLLREVAADAEARGMRSFTGHCVPMEGGTPYLPFVEILEEALIAPKSPLVMRDALGEHAAEISRLVPRLRRVFPDLPPPLDIPPEQAQRYLWLSAEGFLREASQNRPLLLLLEDLHWADEATLLLLGHLAPRLGDVPLLLIGSYRDTEVDPSHPLARLIEQLTRRRLVQRTSLGPLPREAVTRMLHGLAGQPPPAELVAEIYRGTEGNPFFIEEVYLHLSEAGSLLDAEGRFRSDLRIGELDVPESVRLAVGGRLERLSPETRDALAAAAISGRVFEPAVVGRVSGLDPDALLAALGEAEVARLIAPSDPETHRTGFVHELIRQTLLAETPSLLRQKLHRDTARAIEELHADDVEDHAADLAFHLARSGPGVDPMRLAGYLRTAGDRAFRASAFGQAIAHFEHALTLVPLSESPPRAELLERLANAQRSAGNWDGALATMDRAFRRYERLGFQEAVGRLCWAMVYQLTWGARFEEAVGLAGRGLAALGDLPNPDRARLLSVTGWVTGLAGDHAGATALFQEARGIVEALGDRRALADVLHMETAHHMTYLEFSQGAESGLRGARVFEAEGSLWDLCSVLGFVEFQLGTILRHEEAAALTDRVDGLAHRLGHLGARFLVISDRIRWEGVISGDLLRTRTLARESIEVCRKGGLPWLYVGHLYMGFTAHWAGRWDEAERELRRALELETPGAFSGQAAAHLAIHLAERGREEEVRALFERVRPTLPSPGRVNSLGQWNTLLGFVEALALVGRPEDVAGFHETLQDALALGEWVTFDCRLVRTRAGIVAGAAGRWGEAERHFDAARETAERIGHRIEVADILRLRARMLRARGRSGDAATAETLVRESAARFRELGMEARAAWTEEAEPSREAIRG